MSYLKKEKKKQKTLVDELDGPVINTNISTCIITAPVFGPTSTSDCTSKKEVMNKTNYQGVHDELCSESARETGHAKTSCVCTKFSVVAVLRNRWRRTCERCRFQRLRRRSEGARLPENRNRNERNRNLSKAADAFLPARRQVSVRSVVSCCVTNCGDWVTEMLDDKVINQTVLNLCEW